MAWTEEDTNALRTFRHSVDSDDIKVKEQIKRVLLNNRFIVHVLNNKELAADDAKPDEYFYENILPYYLIPETQTSTKNFLCYEVSYKDVDRYNSTVKILQVTFHILCHHEDLNDEETCVARHDLLAALVQDQFNYTTYVGGGKLRLVSDVASVTDNHYATRTLTFEQITDNNIVKHGKIINKEIQPTVSL